MDSMQQVTRINPQMLIAILVSPATVGQISALFTQLYDQGYTTTNHTGADQNGVAIANGGWRLIISHKSSGAADQVIYYGDRILVADAEYNSTTGEWSVSRATRVSCYGVSTELAGSVEDFDATFTAVLAPEVKAAT